MGSHRNPFIFRHNLQPCIAADPQALGGQGGGVCHMGGPQGRGIALQLLKMGGKISQEMS